MVNGPAAVPDDAAAAGTAAEQGPDLAVCTLADRRLAARAATHPRVAAAGPLATANVGIEELVRAVVAHDGVRRLVVAGRESRLFRPGQSLLALAANGVDDSGRIIGALGHEPYLRTLRPGVVAEFRRRVTVVDLRGCADEARLVSALDAQPRAAAAGRDPSRTAELAVELAGSGPRVVRLSPGGRRRPLSTAGTGFFVVTVDAARRLVVLRHYAKDLTDYRELTGHSAEALLLGAIGHELIGPGELSHAGYLGAELAKAETALRLGLPYVQDRPLTGR
ncbi:hypothetical protein ACIBCM_22750 [Streptomyces sp. NPDC051018]|uniref:DUF4346 domain-containing protein n=1 Tax=Streptomyces sp. NPDC051018 TaxID=3365639 RepID=UPI00379C4E10